MLFPLIINRILNRIHYDFAELVIRKENTRHYKEYSNWLAEYESLTTDDKKNILKKFKRLQTATIVFGIQKCDPEIFVNQLGIFYIKPTTMDYYNKLNSLLNNNEDNKSFQEIHTTALEDCRKRFINRANLHKHGNKERKLKIKI